jgi:hypothetical protein
VESSSGLHGFFTVRATIRSRPPRIAGMARAIAVVVALVGLKAGCGPGPGGAAPMVKDPAPLAPEETTEALIKSKTKAKPVARPQRR